jgi:hypothetical protein
MTIQKNNCSISEKHESGEDQLMKLIKQAGDDARARKKKTLEFHYKKLKAVIAEGVARRKNHE